METERVYDVIVVGGGIGGLSAGAILSKKGYSVLLLEKNSLPGGNCNYFEYSGIRFEFAVHQITTIGSDTGMGWFLRELGIRTEFIRINDLLDIYYPERSFRISGSFDSYLDALNRFRSCKQNREYIAFLRDVSCLVEHYDWLFSGKILSPPEMNLPFCVRGPFSLFRFLKSADMTSEQFMKRFFPAIADNEMAYFLAPYIGLPPDRSAAIMNICANSSYLSKGSYYPAGGSRALSEAFCDVIKNNGGSVLLNSEVTEVRKREGKFRVSTRGGGIYSSRALVLNAPVKYALDRIIAGGEEPDEYKRKIEKLACSLSPLRIFCIYEGDTSVFDKMGYESFMYESSSLRQYFADIMDGKYSGFSVLLPFKIDPENRQGNRVPVIITTLTKYLTDEEFEVRKESVLDRIFGILDKYAKGISSGIQIASILTPEGLKKRTNVDSGAMYGWECSPGQALFNRLKQETNIEGMFLSGHWTRPVNGISGVIRSGTACAKLVSRYLKRH